MKPIEQQLQREADNGYPGPDSWQVSKVSSGDMKKEIDDVEKLWAAAIDHMDHITCITKREADRSDATMLIITRLRDIAIEAIKQRYHDNR